MVVGHSQELHGRCFTACKFSHQSLLIPLAPVFSQNMCILLAHLPKMQHQLCILFLLSLLFLQNHTKFCNGLSITEVNSLTNDELDAMVKRVCRGKISDCLGRAVDEDDQMDSESNRRVLMFQKRYISYDTLKRDTVPCSKPGASYYNCKGVANSYSRGCELITRCARGD
ncbi:protein RALF-like 24 [Olea europaea var. sylvestris]|uniref:protein RALF-like 24 n=1 Tax=Olea europaea var. sylvestris TaxID=158386 RepID=UPI000C1D5335|nr:protein RALF-like 24 [Olea europaea var. sylvestris]XP_022887187.1 protein RALF-like 24 [Olea europaea var. sylvestris]